LTPGWLTNHFELTFGHSGTQGWAPEYSNVNN